jgi:hypothetical protein
MTQYLGNIAFGDATQETNVFGLPAPDLGELAFPVTTPTTTRWSKFKTTPRRTAATVKILAMAGVAKVHAFGDRHPRLTEATVGSFIFAYYFAVSFILTFLFVFMFLVTLDWALSDI